MKEIIIVMLSGGLDSAYLLYDYLANTDKEIHAHHISMRYPSEPRWEHELKASRAVAEFCKKNYRAFGYSESRWDFPFAKHVGWDSDLCLLTATKIAPNLDADLVSVALGWNHDDLQRPWVQHRVNNQINSKLWKAVIDSTATLFPNILNDKYYSPLIENKIGKKQMIATIPKKLLDLTWSCRRPINNQPCKQCQACKDIIQAIGSEVK